MIRSYSVYKPVSVWLNTWFWMKISSNINVTCFSTIMQRVKHILSVRKSYPWLFRQSTNELDYDFIFISLAYCGKAQVLNSFAVVVYLPKRYFRCLRASRLSGSKVQRCKWLEGNIRQKVVATSKIKTILERYHRFFAAFFQQWI